MQAACVTGTPGMTLAVVVYTGSVQGRDGVKRVLPKLLG